MNRLCLNLELETQVRKLAEETYPHECCGFLIGIEKAGKRQVTEIIPALNERSDSPANRFLITAEATRQVEKDLGTGTGQIIGFFHSHPDCAAEPSRYDLDHAWPWYSYVIVQSTARGTKELRSWRLLDDRSRFLEEELC